MGLFACTSSPPLLVQKLPRLLAQLFPRVVAPRSAAQIPMGLAVVDVLTESVAVDPELVGHGVHPPKVALACHGQGLLGFPCTTPFYSQRAAKRKGGSGKPGPVTKGSLSPYPRNQLLHQRVDVPAQL